MFFYFTALNPGKVASGKIVVPLEKIPGVFVREVLPEPCLDVRHTKRTVSVNIVVCKMLYWIFILTNENYYVIE